MSAFSILDKDQHMLLTLIHWPWNHLRHLQDPACHPAQKHHAYCTSGISQAWRRNLEHRAVTINSTKRDDSIHTTMCENLVRPTRIVSPNGFDQVHLDLWGFLRHSRCMIVVKQCPSRHHQHHRNQNHQDHHQRTCKGDDNRQEQFLQMCVHRLCLCWLFLRR